MKKSSHRSLLSWGVLSGLVACGGSCIPFGDPFYSLSVDVNLSESFLATRSTVYPLRVKAHFESHPAQHFSQEGFTPPDGDVGVVCIPASGPVQLHLPEFESGCAPRDMSVTVSVVPASEYTPGACAGPMDGGMTDGGTTSPPPQDPATSEVTQTAQVKILDCSHTEPVVFEF